jgi:hypothetical protein
VKFLVSIGASFGACQNMHTFPCPLEPPHHLPLTTRVFQIAPPPQTQNYEHHAIVKFLESIGASFGACQNAYTSCDETVYTLMVRTDEAQLLDTSVGVLAEFAARIRCGGGGEGGVAVGLRIRERRGLAGGKQAAGRLCDAWRCWQSFCMHQVYGWVDWGLLVGAGV